MTQYSDKLHELLKANTPCVSVILVETTGSVPGDPGNKMLVIEAGLYYGTVGGGAVEKRAIDEAMSLLKQESGPGTSLVSWGLNNDLGMTCGGTVKLFFEAYNRSVWKIAVFGAGHVAAALINQLLLLECRITCIDPRPEWLDRLPHSGRLTKVVSADMPSYVKELSDEAFVVLLTIGHPTDQAILFEILSTRTFPYVGVIGSPPKAATLRREVVAAGMGERQDSFHCPIGLPLGSNQPEEIAISIVAQLIQERDRWQGGRRPAARQQQVSTT
jgi:xanthine dehydrogenase accessory factor